MTDKYEKMVKIGIPTDAVRHAMIKDQVCKSIIDQFFSLADTAPCASCNNYQPTENRNTETNLIQRHHEVIKMGFLRDLGRHNVTLERGRRNLVTSKCGNENVPVDESKHQRSNKSDLVSIYWEKMPTDIIDFDSENLWAIIANNPKARGLISPYIDEEMLHQMFQKNTSKDSATKLRAVSTTTTSSSQHEMAKILSNNRAQNICISLHAFKEFTFDELASIISEIDSKHQIIGDRVAFLKALLPKQAEATAILQYKGDIKRLSDAELFFRRLLLVPRVHKKVKVIETLEFLKQRADDVISSFHVLTKTCENVMKSEKLRLILELVLSVGNILNDGSRYGDAVGIKIASLVKLTQTKSFDRKSTVLDYIVAMIMKKNGKAALDLRRDIPQCLDASHLHVSDILSNFNSIVMSWNECQMEYSKMKDDNREMGGDASPGLHRLGSFIGRSTSTIARLNMSKEDALNGCRKLINYCGEKETEAFATSILTSLTSFIKSIDEAVSKYEMLKRKENRKNVSKSMNQVPTMHTIPMNSKSEKATYSLYKKHLQTDLVPPRNPPLQLQNGSSEKVLLQPSKNAGEKGNHFSPIQNPDPRQVVIAMLKKRPSEGVPPHHSDKCERTSQTSALIVRQSKTHRQMNLDTSFVSGQSSTSKQSDCGKQDANERIDKEERICSSNTFTIADEMRDDKDETSDVSCVSTRDQSEKKIRVLQYANHPQSKSKTKRKTINTSRNIVKKKNGAPLLHIEGVCKPRSKFKQKRSTKSSKKLLQNILNQGPKVKHGSIKIERRDSGNKIHQKRNMDMPRTVLWPFKW